MIEHPAEVAAARAARAGRPGARERWRAMFCEAGEAASVAVRANGVPNHEAPCVWLAAYLAAIDAFVAREEMPA